MVMSRSTVKLEGETLSGSAIAFSRDAFVSAMRLYRVHDIAYIALRLEKGKEVDPEVANFFRDFAIIQEETNPDYDVGRAIGSLAARIELATGQVTAQELAERGIDLESDCLEYHLIFG